MKPKRILCYIGSRNRTVFMGLPYEVSEEQHTCRISRVTPIWRSQNPYAYQSKVKRKTRVHITYQIYREMGSTRNQTHMHTHESTRSTLLIPRRLKIRCCPYNLIEKDGNGNNIKYETWPYRLLIKTHTNESL